MLVKSLVIKLENNNSLEIKIKDPCEEIHKLYNKIKCYDNDNNITYKSISRYLHGEVQLPIKIRAKTKNLKLYLAGNSEGHYGDYVSEILLTFNTHEAKYYKDSVFVKIENSKKLLNIEDFITMLKCTYIPQTYKEYETSSKISYSYNLYEEKKFSAFFNIGAEDVYTGNKGRRPIDRYMELYIQHTPTI